MIASIKQILVETFAKAECLRR